MRGSGGILADLLHLEATDAHDSNLCSCVIFFFFLSPDKGLEKASPGTDPRSGVCKAGDG